MIKKALLFCFILFACSLNNTGYAKTRLNKPQVIDSPLKALVVYFPSPAVTRCLNHSDIPREFHKASIYRKAKFPNKEEIEESIFVGVKNGEKSGRRFSFVGTVKSKSEIAPSMIRGEIAFGAQDQRFSLGLFGLENFLGLQGKVHIKDKIGHQKISYETFLKSTKGKIGDQKYNLELSGEDRVIDKRLTYLLTGNGMLGRYDISVNAKDVKKDNYEIIEKYGPVEIFTTVRVYD